MIDLEWNSRDAPLKFGSNKSAQPQWIARCWHPPNTTNGKAQRTTHNNLLSGKPPLTNADIDDPSCRTL